MAIEMHSIQGAYAPGHAYLIEEFPPSTRPFIRSQLDSTKPCLMPDGSITVSPPSPTTKMKALPQRPGPGGSRVIRKRSSIPHLGDGLLTVFSSNITPAKSSAAYTEPNVSATLTRNNLSQLAKSTHPDGNFVFNGTPSMCSDEDIVLIGTPNQSINSISSSRLSSGSGTPWGADTPPTTLTGDDSSFCSDDEITLGSSSSTPVNSKTTSSTRFSVPPTYKSDDSAARTKLLSPIAFSFSEKDRNAHSPYLKTCRSANNSLDLFETVSIDTVVETIPSTELIPDTESLHGIVRSFLATNAKVKSASPFIAETLPSLSPSLEAVDKAKPFWIPERLFAFYIKGAITPAKAKETAKRHGYLDVIPVIDEAEALKKKNPSLDISDIITIAGNEGHFGVLGQPTEISATTSRDQHDTVYHDFMLKLATYSAEDNSAGSVKPLHIFVDMSNIHIGFCNSWKISQNIPVERRIRAPSFNFKVLASIMERSRAAKKKVLASSVASHIVSKTQWPQHFVDAEKHGYKTSILNRVQKVSPVKAGRRCRISAQGPGVAYSLNLMTSGDESAEDTAGISYETRNGEQGVDEILHLNMMNSILDDMQEPGSMILATGDAAQAEFSEGFLEYANRALSQGWNLELVTWRATISSAWMNPAFRSKHGKRFRIIYLDDFLEELNADLRPSLA